MNRDQLLFEFKNIKEQIETLYKYIKETPMQQQVIAELEALDVSISNLELLKEEMQASLETMEIIEEQLLQQNENIIRERKHYYNLFKFAPNAYLVIDAQGRIKEINYAAALLNMLPSFLVGKLLINFVSREEHPFFHIKLNQSLNVKSVQEWEVSICPRNAQAFDALLLVKPVREAFETQSLLQICLYDITKYKHIQRSQLAASQQPVLSEPVKTPYRLDGLRVLFVDDEADTRELITAVLKQYGVIVTTVASVTEALSELERSRPDVIISDLRMPEEDGYTLIRKIKALEIEKGWQIPTAALTAYLAEDRAKAMRAGFQSHLHKLAEPTELVAMVAQLAGRSEK
ncbi:MAG: response regulator [Nostoc sp.]|uniref:response regulator n=1 Tax=Nostoc sp. TaxID=1180 RepID=UPI002FFD05D9